MNCEMLKNRLPDLLLDASFRATAEGARAEAHLAECHVCAEELRGLQATMGLLDLWQAPAVSPYFDTRMQTRMREEVAAAPAGFWQRLTHGFPLLASLSLKPVIAGVMACAIVIGGATYAGVNFFEQPHSQVAESATLRDLQSLDRNSQTIDDLNSLDQQLNSQPADDTSGSNSE
jgi:hypothetical protein